MPLHPREIFSGMRRWWQNWIQANSSLAELACCGEYEAQRMAHDLGLPVSELRMLAEHGPEAADLLARRIAALDLDRDEIATAVPRTLQDLQRVCTMCESHRQCARDLGRGLLPECCGAEDVECIALGSAERVVIHGMKRLVVIISLPYNAGRRGYDSASTRILDKPL
jgi:hypothetical protein